MQERIESSKKILFFWIQNKNVDKIHRQVDFLYNRKLTNNKLTNNLLFNSLFLFHQINLKFYQINLIFAPCPVRARDTMF